MAAPDPRELDAFMAALKAQESGGDVDARNPRTGAYGLWQIMPSNWPSWSRATFGEVRPQTADNQYRVARHIMSGYYNEFGRWDAVAVAWFAGPGRARDFVQGESYVLGLSDGYATVAEYIDKAEAGMTRLLGSGTDAWRSNPTGVTGSTSQTDTDGDGIGDAPTTGPTAAGAPFDLLPTLPFVGDLDVPLWRLGQIAGGVLLIGAGGLLLVKDLTPIGRVADMVGAVGNLAGEAA